ncbi:MAG: NUDIX hydrolase [Chloroflexi bacterium]|nr:NUDIX hydrolase [Chloroflexota bacterium]
MSEEILQSEYRYRGRVVNLRLDRVRLATRQIAAREIVEHRGAVAIVALDARKRVLLVKQYRSGAGCELLEIPAGTLEPDEDPAQCAARELQEETGYRAAQWQDLGSFYSSPGILTEKMYLFLARKLTRGAASPDDDELIRAQFVSLARAQKMIERGELVDAKTIIGLLRVHSLLVR